MSNFSWTAKSARAAGYRACLRCKPDEVGREALAVTKAVKLIEQAEDAISLTDLADAVGYAPHHFQRVFTRALGRLTRRILARPARKARG